MRFPSRALTWPTCDWTEWNMLARDERERLEFHRCSYHSIRLDFEHQLRVLHEDADSLLITTREWAKGLGNG